MASIRGILNSQSLNELTSEKRNESESPDNERRTQHSYDTSTARALHAGRNGKRNSHTPSERSMRHV